jgi:CRISPR-associated endoribonuclease Cas6
MRLILKLKSLKEVSQNKENNSKFYTAMNSWIYEKLRGSDFKDMHSKNEFKEFCFSNLFPIKNKIIKQGQELNLVLSSSNNLLINEIIKKIKLKSKINLGEYSFELIYFKQLLSKKVNDFMLLENESILNLTFHELNDKKPNKIKAITLNENKELFENNLRKNLIRKFNQFNGDKINEDFDLWENIEIKEIPNSKKSVRLNFLKEQEYTFFNVIGSRFKFKLGKLNETQKKILQLGYDSGFGERNAFGFGFINIKSGVNI